MDQSSFVQLFKDLVKQVRNTLSVLGAKPEASLYGAFRQFIDATLEGFRPNVNWALIEQADAQNLGIPDYTQIAQVPITRICT